MAPQEVNFKRPRASISTIDFNGQIENVNFKRISGKIDTNQQSIFLVKLK